MKFVVFVGILAVALAAPPKEVHDWTWVQNYHENIGIPEAARIKAAEEASDFDGNRIVGGSNAALGQYPHMGGLVITMTTGQTSVCGSSLLTNTRAVTAAHCWSMGNSQARQFTVVLGSLSLFSGGTRITTSNVQMHANWNPSTIQNDVAIIIMSHVNYGNNIRNIALPSGTLLNNNFVGWAAAAAGFGAQRDGAGIGNNQQLHHATNLPVISNAECQRSFGNSIIASTLCINGASGRSTCGGDSGGPLQVNSGGAVLIGITSFGFSGGCQRGWPAAFARVTSFASWIQARI